MYGLIKILYDYEKRLTFENLYVNSDLADQFLLRATLAASLKDCPKLLPSNGTDWILCTLCQFNKTEEDTARVFQSLMTMLFEVRDIGVLNSKIEIRPASEIADSCLVNIGLFKSKVEMMCKRRGAPSVEYYSHLGSLAFHQIGYDGIADDFNGWTDFLEKEFTL